MKYTHSTAPIEIDTDDFDPGYQYEGEFSVTREYNEGECVVGPRGLYFCAVKKLEGVKPGTDVNLWRPIDDEVYEFEKQFPGSEDKYLGEWNSPWVGAEEGGIYRLERDVYRATNSTTEEPSRDSDEWEWVANGDASVFVRGYAWRDED